jgi:hypothetical protein
MCLFLNLGHKDTASYLSWCLRAVSAVVQRGANLTSWKFFVTSADFYFRFLLPTLVTFASTTSSCIGIGEHPPKKMWKNSLCCHRHDSNPRPRRQGVLSFADSTCKYLSQHYRQIIEEFAKCCLHRILQNAEDLRPNERTLRIFPPPPLPSSRIKWENWTQLLTWYTRVRRVQPWPCAKWMSWRKREKRMER